VGGERVYALTLVDIPTAVGSVLASTAATIFRRGLILYEYASVHEMLVVRGPGGLHLAADLQESVQMRISRGSPNRVPFLRNQVISR
jgi:hypothetical protein